MRREFLAVEVRKMPDLAQTVIPKSDQLNADALIPGPITVTITRVTAEKTEQPVTIYFEGDNGQPYKPSKAMRRVLIEAWGREGDAYIGRRLTLYRDASVLWAGKPVGGIRISHMSGIRGPLKTYITISQGKKEPFTVQPLAEREATTPPEIIAAQNAAAGGISDLLTWKAENPEAFARHIAGKPIQAALQRQAKDADAKIQNPAEMPGALPGPDNASEQ